MNQTNTTSIAVIFEVVPADGKKDEYLDIAASLKPELEKIRGFISVERFQSLTHPEKILSLSFSFTKLFTTVVYTSHTLV